MICLLPAEAAAALRRSGSAPWAHAAYGPLRALELPGPRTYRAAETTKSHPLQQQLPPKNVIINDVALRDHGYHRECHWYENQPRHLP
jgi:hypothetical protein